MTTSPGSVLVTRFGVRTTDSRDWIAAADHAFQPYGEAWTSGPRRA